MELRHLRYFEVLASTLNFTRAAERLHIAQPALSRQIQQLEEELEITLIDRNTRPPSLTRAGSFFYEQSTQILARLDEVVHTAQRLSAGHRRWLGVGFVPSMLYGFLPAVIRQFMESHADVDLVLSELTSVQQVEALRAGRIDVGFGRVVLDADGLVNTLLDEEPLIAVLPVDATPSQSSSLTLRDLAEQVVVIYPAQPRPSFADQVLSQFRLRGLSVNKTFETNGLQTAIGLVAAGVGVTIVPKSVQRLKRDDVVYRPISDLGVTTSVLMTTRFQDPSSDVAEFCRSVQSSQHLHAQRTA